MKRLDVSSGNKTIVQNVDAVGFFYSNETKKIYNDPRRVSIKGRTIDPLAVFSVLQYGGIIPPLSPWKEVKRLLPGAIYYNDLSFCNSMLPDIEKQVEEKIKKDDISLIEGLIDRSLDCRKSKVLLFSGGVDSGLIAVRAAFNSIDVKLLNFCFGNDDTESIVAEKMARILGLNFNRIMVNDQDLTSVLNDPGRLYPFPFADHSTVPTAALARAVVNCVEKGSVILDGTGADGAYGMSGKISGWLRAIHLPVSLRKLVGKSYYFLWQTNGRSEYYSRLCRRSIQMPIVPAMLAQNALAGIFYNDDIAEQVHNLLNNWLQFMVGRGSLLRQAVAGDMALICANIFAQKARPILVDAGFDVVYPYMTPEAFVAGLVASEKPMSEAKAPLKQALAKHVPRDFVYRPKSGFIDPTNRIFYTENFLTALHDATHGPIGSFLNKKSVLKTVDHLSRGGKLPAQTLNAAWAAAFTDRWYRTV
jgi:asparagine synthase (glutamine-hydrolysing)